MSLAVSKGLLPLFVFSYVVLIGAAQNTIPGSGATSRRVTRRAELDSTIPVPDPEDEPLTRDKYRNSGYHGQRKSSARTVKLLFGPASKKTPRLQQKVNEVDSLPNLFTEKGKDGNSEHSLVTSHGSDISRDLSSSTTAFEVPSSAKTPLTEGVDSKTHVAESRHVEGTATQERELDAEEQKLKLATNKLVKWLRNRLRKRLEDVANLEHEMTTENVLLENLESEIKDTSEERKSEIREKIATQKELSEFRRHSTSPDATMERVKSQTTALSEQLEKVKDAYESMAARHKDLKDKLRSAGLTHWLEARGKEYFPETAVGVLSKSAQILGPVTHGFQKVVSLDDMLSRKVERVMHGSDEGMYGSIVWDLTMLIPFVPFLCLLRVADHAFHHVSMFHIVLCGSALFAAESFISFILSVFLGKEVLSVTQKVNETILVALVLLNAVLYTLVLFSQVLISCLHSSRNEGIQVILMFTIGYRYYYHVFQPAMLGRPIMITLMSHIVHILTFSLVFIEKKRLLDYKTPYDLYFNKLILGTKDWVMDTFQAMLNVFSDIVPHGSRARTSEYGSQTSYASTFDGDHSFQTIKPVSEEDEQRTVSLLQENSRYLGHNRWYEVNRSASLIRKTFTASQLYGDHMHSTVKSTGKGTAQETCRSSSNNSAAYQSCRE
ncbi:hypothetical protein BWQ96_04316 [Gracilariopsis chorda]|uniref:Uncharacterized protein n=1 Tax=Gracilariopsis chorda TaxID=448386 RepID=A0A2V3IUU0_9FLOR|nr:hypothetical protein BWQ96_04316 [Gracilariopsis chorda]|eukprot:PXF45881.1 hypothetical protein BWQ96_04316 [Gracilariopsis chorda]